MGQNKYKELISNTYIFAIGSIGSKLITFFLVPLYTNILTIEQYGTADFVISCSNLLVPVVSFVIQDAVLRFGLSKDADHNKIAKNSILVFLFGTVMMVLCTPIANFYEPLSKWKWYFCAYVISCNAANIMYSFAKAINRNKLYTVASLIHALTLAVVNILLLVVFPCGVIGYLIANILSNYIPAAIVFFATKIPMRIHTVKYDPHLMKEMLAYSIPLIANNLSWWLLNSSNRILIEYYLSTSEVGLFSAASKIPSLLSIVTSIFSSAWSISSIKEYEGERSGSFYTNVFNLFSMVLFIGGASIILILKPLMSIYVGADFFKAWVYVPLLIYGIVFYSFSSYFGTIYGSVKKNLPITVTTVIAASINVILSIILIPQIGVFGCVIATMVGYLTVGIIRIIHSRKYIKVKFNYLKFCLNSVVLLLQVIAASMDIYVYAISVLSIVLMLIINFNEIKNICRVLFTHKRK